MNSIISITNLNKKYEGGFEALKNVNLEVQEGEIYALLGPNGAGKTTLISIVCGLTNISSGTVQVGGFDITKDSKKTRSLIGLVPQELTTDAFETVWDTVSFSRGLFGKAKDPKHIESVLKKLSLWDKKDNKIMTLSGGMKRRVMIAKALSHEPKVLFLDEPTAGVDVELRKDMWGQVRELKSSGVTIILTTHYIEEAEEMADRVGVINKGQLILTENKSDLMEKLGKKSIHLTLDQPLSQLPESLEGFSISIDGTQLEYSFDTQNKSHSVSDFFEVLNRENIKFNDIRAQESTLEEIFVELVKKNEF